MRSSRRFIVAVHALAIGYTVTEDGRIFSPEGVERKCRMKGADKRYAYWDVTIRDPDDGTTRPIPVHVLQAITKFGAEAVAKAPTIRHKDGDSGNNHRDNLELGTHTENYMDRAPESRKEHALKAARVQRRLSDEDVARLRALHKAGRSGNALALEFGLSKSTVSYIVNKKTYA